MLKIIPVHAGKNYNGEYPPKNQMVLWQTPGGDINIGGYDHSTGFWFSPEEELVRDMDTAVYWVLLGEISPEWVYIHGEPRIKIGGKNGTS